MAEPLMMDIAQQAGFRDGKMGIVFSVSKALGELRTGSGKVRGGFWEGFAQILGKVSGQVLGRFWAGYFFAQKR